MVGSRWLVSSLAVLVLVGAGCAGTTTKKIELSPAEIAAEELKQRTIVLQSHREQEQRLADISFPILRGAVPLCGEDVEPRGGFAVENLDAYDEDWREPARAAFDIDSRLQVTTIASGSPADEAGLKAGDVLVQLAGEPAPVGEKATTDLAERLRESIAKDRPLSLAAERDGSRVSLTITPTEICDYPTRVLPVSELNAYADGKGIFLTSSMMRFADDHELSVIVAHELAHNAMDHIEKRKKNTLLGAIVGAVLDVAISGATGYSTGGVYTSELAESGAKAFSQDFETEADYVGLYAMALTGVPLEGAPRLWRHMAQANPKSIGLAHTHPTTVERFLRMERTIEEIRVKEAQGLALRPDPKDADADVRRPELARATEARTEERETKAGLVEPEAGAAEVLKSEGRDAHAPLVEEEEAARPVVAETQGDTPVAKEPEADAVLPTPIELERPAPTNSRARLVEIGCTISEVMRGDSFRCESGSEVRLAAVRAQAEDEPYGRIATQSLRAMLRPGSEIRMVVPSRSKEERKLYAFVFIEDGTFVNEFLASRGYVYPDVEGASTDYASRIATAARRAEVKGLGIWSRP